MADDFITDDTKAIILLCGILGKDRSVKPLTQGEYSALVRWLIKETMRPKDLLDHENIDLAATGAGCDKERLTALLNRGVQLGFAIEEWQRNGIWVISRSDNDYPRRYKTHLKEKAPPLLFGAGDRSLLLGGGVAIVGSRNVDTEGEEFTHKIAKLCVNNKMPIVSGGARGVDQIAMTTALDTGGVTIGVLAENLLQKSIVRKTRQAIADGRMLLISPFHPNARFSVGTAMGRNKFIYALADYALVVSAEYKKGGTWAGAEEELRRETSITVFVRPGNNAPSGNHKLIDLGAIEWPEITFESSLNQQLATISSTHIQESKKKNLSLFDFQNQSSPQNEKQKKADKAVTCPTEPKLETSSNKTPAEAIFEAVLPVIINQIDEPITAQELSARLEISKPQMNNWLKKAVSQGKARKLSRPVRFCKIQD
ncbi:MAG: DNA-protecting protein DprA [Magnetococcales bacterium]|nr:DNA-protecting protein DprA [Magnetococcales bacterium]